MTEAANGGFVLDASPEAIAMNIPLVHRLLFSLCLATVMACSASSLPVETPSPEAGASIAVTQLLGRWQLARVCGGLRGACTPAVESGEPQEYVFRSDNSVDASYRAQPSVHGTYRLGRDPDPNRRNDVVELRSGAQAARVLALAISTDGVLTLSERHPDGFSFEYRR